MSHTNETKVRRIEKSKIVIALAAMTALAASANAAPIYWDGTGTTWNAVGSWSTDPSSGTPDPSAVPGLADDVVFSTSTVAANVALTLNANQSANSLTFNNTTGLTTNITGGGNRDITIGSGGITVAAGSGAVTIGTSTSNQNVFPRLLASQTWTNNSSSTLNVRNSMSGSTSAVAPIVWTVNAAGSGNISDSGALNDGSTSVALVVASTGTGTVSISGGTYSGGTTVRSGNFQSSSFGTGAVLLGDTSGALDARLTISGSNALANDVTVRSGSSGSKTLTSTGTTPSPVLNGLLELNDSIAVTPASGMITLNGLVSGVGSITKSGNGALLLAGANTYEGGTTLSAGILRINNGGDAATNSAIGTGVLTIGGGTIDNTSGSAVTLLTNNQQVWNSNFTFTGTEDLTLGTGSVSLGTASGTARTVTTTGGQLTVGGEISNGTTATGLTKAGAGTLTLSSASSSYTGITTVGTGGVLEVIKLANANTPSSIGAPTNTTGPTVLNGTGVLRYIGTGDSTNRVLTIGGGGGGSLDASGTGAIVFSNSSSSAFGSSNVAYTLNLIGTNTDDNTYAANQNNNGSGAFSITKSGTGTWVLSGNAGYTGATTVNGGLLKITGSLGNTAVAVHDTATLGGSGLIAGSVTVNAGGTLAPGNSPGILSTGDLTLAGDSVLSVELNGTTVGSTYDQANVTGTVSIAGDLSAALGYAPTLGDNLFIINNDGSDAVSGGFANLGVGNTIDLVYSSTAYRFVVSYAGDFATNSATGGNDVVLTNVLVPEPSVLAAAGLSVLGLLRRRRVS